MIVIQQVHKKESTFWLQNHSFELNITYLMKNFLERSYIEKLQDNAFSVLRQNYPKPK